MLIVKKQVGSNQMLAFLSFLFLQHATLNISGDNTLLTSKRTGRHRKSRTLPDGLSSEKAMSKFRDSSGVADVNTGRR